MTYTETYRITGYGETVDFATLDEAEAAIRQCATALDPSWAAVTLRALVGGRIVNERGETVGRVIAHDTSTD